MADVAVTRVVLKAGILESMMSIGVIWLPAFMPGVAESAESAECLFGPIKETFDEETLSSPGSPIPGLSSSAGCSGSSIFASSSSIWISRGGSGGDLAIPGASCRLSCAGEACLAPHPPVGSDIASGLTKMECLNEKIVAKSRKR
jgi:hypothetical protein